MRTAFACLGGTGKRSETGMDTIATTRLTNEITSWVAEIRTSSNIVEKKRRKEEKEGESLVKKLASPPPFFSFFFVSCFFHPISVRWAALFFFLPWVHRTYLNEDNEKRKKRKKRKRKKKRKKKKTEKEREKKEKKEKEKEEMKIVIECFELGWDGMGWMRLGWVVFLRSN